VSRRATHVGRLFESGRDTKTHEDRSGSGRNCTLGLPGWSSRKLGGPLVVHTQSCSGQAWFGLSPAIDVDGAGQSRIRLLRGAAMGTPQDAPARRRERRRRAKKNANWELVRAKENAEANRPKEPPKTAT
jgi:hypothetical protein